jgi:hypothetical protein
MDFSHSSDHMNCQRWLAFEGFFRSEKAPTDGAKLSGA